jgi:hypothetical protein
MYSLHITYLFTPWSRILLEKRTVNFAASQEIPRIYGTFKVKKSNGFPVRVIQAYCGSRGSAIPVLNLDTRWRWVVNFPPWWQYPWGGAPDIHWTGCWVEPWAILDVLEHRILQGVPLPTKPGISLVILTPVMILQRNLNRSTLVVWEMWRHHNMRWKWPPFASRQDWTRRAIFWKVLARMFANNNHSLLQSIPIHFPTILCELTIYTDIHEQQLYCVGTLSQMTERSSERRVRQETAG